MIFNAIISFKDFQPAISYKAFKPATYKDLKLFIRMFSQL